jgi:uncharacterized protein YqeY
MESKLRELIKQSMLSKDKNKTTLYKNILESAQKSAKEKNESLNDSYIISAVKKEIKQMEDLLTFCKDRPEKYNETTENIKLASELLPKAVDNDTVRNYLVENNLDKNMGVCMKALKAKFGDALDSKSASQVVKEYISE